VSSLRREASVVFSRTPEETHALSRSPRSTLFYFTQVVVGITITFWLTWLAFDIDSK
jgi:hypothetical protein